jgi:dinuclear metal center YbgI/SA1388 family protein
MNLSDLCSYLDGYLRISEVEDDPNALNGLQVENPGTVTRLAVAVDACQVTIDAAVDTKADFMLVHHGLFWRGAQPITGRHGRRIRTLVRHGIALYAAHIPLDVHPEVGNNAVLAGALGLENQEWFGDYLGQAIGVAGSVECSRADLIRHIEGVLGVATKVIATGPAEVRRVGVISGGAGKMIRDAVEAGIDTFVTGEGAHHTYFDAEELGINVVYAGHYATETVGVKALAAHLEEKYGLPWDFLDHPTGL